jgi:hypothetical protein
MSDSEVVRSGHPPLRSARPRQPPNWPSRIRGAAVSVAQVIDLQPLALAPLSAARFLSIGKRSLSRLVTGGEIVARKDGTRTLVDVESLKVYYTNLPVK